MSDINVVVLSGVVANKPNLTMQKNGSRICLFNFLVIEEFELKNGTEAEHPNYITIEVFGRNAEKYGVELIEGEHYTINGYLRVDIINNIERTRVRAYHIQKERRR